MLPVDHDNRSDRVDNPNVRLMRFDRREVYTINSGNAEDQPIDDSRSEGKRVSPLSNALQKSLARIVDNITASWFDQTARCWSRARRFWHAFTGSATFSVGAVYAIAVQRAIYFETVGLAFVAMVSGVLLLPALWFSWLISWKDMNYGPIRLYLTGLALPTIVWIALSRMFLSLVGVDTS